MCLGCAAGHSFDIARRGWVNLLQPQDRRSRRPGDSRAVAGARRRLLERGVAAPLVAALRELVGPVLAESPTPALLDMGCGEGFFLRSLAGEGEVEAHGIDISAEAIDLAASCSPGVTFVVANADRGLPYADASFDVVTSITARRHPEEMRRVLRPGGLVLIVVPAADDLIELRDAVIGRGDGRGGERGERLEATLAPALVPDSYREVRHRMVLDGEALMDALASTYRADRGARRERLSGLTELAVTFAWELRGLRPVAGGGSGG